MTLEMTMILTRLIDSLHGLTVPTHRLSHPRRLVKHHEAHAPRANLGSIARRNAYGD